MSFGKRLKEERKRLKLTQPQLAEIAGTTKGTQLLYEKDDMRANSDYLAAIAKVGIDVTYVLTGERGGVNLSDEEAAFLSLLRRQSKEVRDAALEVLKKGMVLSVQQVIISGNVASGGHGHRGSIINGKK